MLADCILGNLVKRPYNLQPYQRLDRSYQQLSKVGSAVIRRPQSVVSNLTHLTLDHLMKIIQIETVGRLYQQNFHAIAIREHIKHCQRHNILVGFEILLFCFFSNYFRI